MRIAITYLQSSWYVNVKRGSLIWMNFGRENNFKRKTLPLELKRIKPMKCWSNQGSRNGP